MSERTVLQIIAAVITLAIMTAFGLGWSRVLDMMSGDFQWGLIVGVIVTSVVVWLALKLDKRSVSKRGTDQERSRHTIDL